MTCIDYKDITTTNLEHAISTSYPTNITRAKHKARLTHLSCHSKCQWHNRRLSFSIRIRLQRRKIQLAWTLMRWITRWVAIMKALNFKTSPRSLVPKSTPHNALAIPLIGKLNSTTKLTQMPTSTPWKNYMSLSNRATLITQMPLSLKIPAIMTQSTHKPMSRDSSLISLPNSRSSSTT